MKIQIIINYQTLLGKLHPDMNGTDYNIIKYLKGCPKGRGANGTLRPLRGTHPRD